jgi:uncharacterized protein (TIGR02421 family)
MMLTLSEKECIALINKRACFHAEVESGAFIVKIDEYAPIVCTAIHNGHKLRSELNKTCLLSKEERFYEEDPYTDELISSFPIQLIGNDSRFEYDLNRAKALSTYYKTAWEKQIWDKPLSRNQRTKSHLKYQSFYNVLQAVITVIEKQFNNAIVFDIHSYNHKRIEKDTPTFNIGSEQIDVERWGSIVNHFENQLNRITLPNLDVRAASNEVFHGRGYLVTYVNAHFDNTLVIPTEVKKIFLDELSGDAYPLVLEELKAGFKSAVSETAAFFVRRYGKKKTQKADVLSSSISAEVLILDKTLFSLCKNIETLHFINPINITVQRNLFFKKNGYISPSFHYKQLDINPYKFREQLYKLPVENIFDADIQQLYRHVIDNLASKIDLLTTIGTDEFVYNSLKYYGEPSLKDIENARFLLHLTNEQYGSEDKTFNANEAVQYFIEQAKKWNLICSIEESAKIVAKAMVNNEKALLLINKDAVFTQKELHAYAYHELGIHMLTTINAKQHPLKVFSLGLTGNTHTQEGLALYSEYRSGSLTIGRLQTIALRVIAVQYMLEQSDFVKTYHTLMNEFDLEKNFAFTLTIRVYRGGGFTKDHLYLKGFRDVLNLAKNNSIDNLLVGKIGLLDFDITNEIVERGMLSKPQPLFNLAYKPSGDKVLDFIIESIR